MQFTVLTTRERARTARLEVAHGAIDTHALASAWTAWKDATRALDTARSKQLDLDREDTLATTAA